MLARFGLLALYLAGPAFAQDGITTYHGPIQGFPSTIAPAAASSAAGGAGAGASASASSTSVAAATSATSSATDASGAGTSVGAAGGAAGGAGASSGSGASSASMSASMTSSAMGSSTSDASSAQVSAVIAALNAAGLTSLASTITGDSTLSSELQMLVASGQNVTILAPTDAAFAAANATALMNQTFAEQVINYHILHSPATANKANISGVPVALNSFLPYNGTSGMAADSGYQAVIATTDGMNVTSILQGNMAPIAVSGAPVQVGNIKVQAIPSVLPLPSSMVNTLSALGLTSALGAIQAAQLMAGNASGSASVTASASTTSASTSSAMPTSLTDLLNGLQGATVFAPSNDAFTAAMPIIAKLNATQVASVLEYHIVDGAAVYNSNISSAFTVPTYNGYNLNISRSMTNQSNLVVNGYSNVIAPYEVATSNGVVMVVDQVLFPPDLAGMMFAGPLLGSSPSSSGLSAAASSTYMPGQGPMPSGAGVQAAVQNLATGGTGAAASGAGGASGAGSTMTAGGSGAASASSRPSGASTTSRGQAMAVLVVCLSSVVLGAVLAQ